MNQIDKDKLIKMLVTVFGIILLVTVAGKILFKTGDTLDVYAEKNPEVAYATQIPTVTPTPTPTETPTPTPSPTPEPSKVSNSNGSPLLSNGAAIEGRFEPTEGFYCEAVSDELSAKGYDKETELFLHVMYYDNDGIVRDGELICKAEDAEGMLDTFKGFYNIKFAIEKIKLPHLYEFDEEAMIEDNDTFCDLDGVLHVNPCQGPKEENRDE